MSSSGSAGSATALAKSATASYSPEVRIQWFTWSRIASARWKPAGDMYGALNGMMVAPMIRTPLACAALISVWYPAMSWSAVIRGVWPQPPEFPSLSQMSLVPSTEDDRADSGLAESVAPEPGDALLAEARQPVEQRVAADPAVGHG